MLGYVEFSEDCFEFTRTCLYCGEEKPLYDFSNNRRDHIGKQTKCKECEKERVRIYKIEHPDRVKASDKRMREKNKLRSDDVAIERRKRRSEYSKIKYINEGDKLRSQHKEWYENNRDRKLASNRIWREANRERSSELSKNWRIDNLDHCKVREREYRQNNKGISAAGTARYRAAKLRATPPWVDYELIQSFYIEARDITTIMGEPYWVDHIIPLRGKTVCGLHVHTNLQILTKIQKYIQGE